MFKKLYQKIFSNFFILFLLLSIISCSKKNSINRYSKNGVSIIENKIFKRKYKDLTFTNKIYLTDEYLGNIGVKNSTKFIDISDRVIFLDVTSNYQLYSISKNLDNFYRGARLGQSSEESSILFDFVNKNDTIISVDVFSKLTYWDKDLNFFKYKQLDKGFKVVKLFKYIPQRDLFVAHIIKNEVCKKSNILCLLDRNFNIVNKIYQYESEKYSFMVKYFVSATENSLYLAIHDVNSYRILNYDLDGKLLKEIKSNSKKIEYSKEKKEFFLKNGIKKRYKNILSGLNFDKGFLIVQTNYLDKDKLIFDFYKNGEYKFSTRLPKDKIYSFIDGKIYIADFDNDIRYSVLDYGISK